MRYFSYASVELSEDGVGCIWECKYKFHIAQQLELPVEEHAENLQVYEGEDSNIHKVQDAIDYPTLDLLRNRMLQVINALQSSENGQKLVQKMIQSQVIDAFVARCLEQSSYNSAITAIFDKLLPTPTDEQIAKAKEEKHLENINKHFGDSMWFMYDVENTHVFNIQVITANNEAKVRDIINSECYEGKWKVASPELIEVTYEKDVDGSAVEHKFEFAWN